MEQFQLDADLRNMLTTIRESVRKLFEQLRLRDEDGDISGKDRLERVPAFSKRNFGYLVGESSDLAIKEAYRLVAFLEGEEKGGQLTPLAREGLRLVPLDKKLAELRASDLWQDAATRLRLALGSPRDNVGMTAGLAQEAPSPNQGHLIAPPTEASDGHWVDHASDPGNGRTETALVRKLGQPMIGMLIVVAALVGLVIAAKMWPDDRVSGPPRPCLALERASTTELASHRTPHPPPLVAGAPTQASGETSVLIARDSDYVASTWTSSYFSHEEQAGRRRKGGGRSDIRLRVGGWGDTYVSLIRFDLRDDRLAYRATLQLMPLGDTAGFRRTTMTLRAIDIPWLVQSGPDHRLWWSECPLSEAIKTNLPPPGGPGTPYRVDITSLYNNWVSGQQLNHGIMLEPEQIGRGDHGVFNTFHSSRALNEANRPRIIIHY